MRSPETSFSVRAIGGQVATTLREVFVVEFPCGAFRVSRTREGAKEIGDQIAANQVCCERGHDSWEVWRFVSDRCTAMRPTRTLRLVRSK